MMSQNDINIMLKKIAKRFTTELRKKFGPRLYSVVLFGSVARGEAAPLSDIDILVVVDGLPVGRYVRRYVLDDILGRFDSELEKLSEKGIYTRINCHLKTRGEASHTSIYYFDMAEEAKLLYDQNGFFKKILLKTRRKVAALGAKRHRLGKFRYWDLKPDYKHGDVFEL